MHVRVRVGTVRYLVQSVYREDGIGERREASENEPACSHCSSLLPAFHK